MALTGAPFLVLAVLLLSGAAARPGGTEEAKVTARPLWVAGWR